MEDENFDSNDHVSGKRSRSPSETSESSEDSTDKRRLKRSKHVSDVRFEFLSQQVSFLTNLISQNHNEPRPQAGTSLAAEVAIEPTNPITNGLGLRPPTGTCDPDKQQLHLSDLSTTLKDPPFPKSNEKHVEMISQLQRFQCNDWYAIRFSEAQKKYVTTPGFVELNINDELRRFNASGSNEDRLYLLERTYAALSKAILIQKEELRTTLQTLVDWSSDKDTTLSPKSLFEKIEHVFDKDSSFTKVTDDILQISCGRRADCINLRREALLKQIPEDYHYGALQKIPPSAENLFDNDMLAAYLLKIGGADKLTASFRQPAAAAAATPYGQKRAFDNKSKPSTSKQTSDNFRRNSFKDRSKGRTKSSNNSGNKSSNAKNKERYTKSKKPRSQSPYRNNRS